MTEINTKEVNDIRIIVVSGEIDASTSIQLDNTLKEASMHTKKIAVDMADLEYISSAGLGVFISHIDEFQSQDIKMVLFGIQDQVREVFSILGLEKLLEIYDSEKDAINSFNEG
jgi:anti-sigma B factor antagonist